MSDHTLTRLGLHWPLKRSFLSYISSLADGACSATDGCVIEEGYGFWFASADAAGTSYVFRGDLRFGGHHGMLFLRIADPTIDIAGEQGTISVLNADDDRVMVATFRVSEALESFAIRGIDVHLSESGADLFGGVYRPGQPLDDFVVLLPAADIEATLKGSAVPAAPSHLETV